MMMAQEIDLPGLAGTRLMGKVAVITGGARGIGAASAKIFAQNGAHVVIADILDDLGTAVADSVGGRYARCDVAKEADVESAINLAIAWKGKLDIMFNNAGIASCEGSITDIDADYVKSIFSVNIMGVIYGIKHAAKAMIKTRNAGSIICTASSSAIMGGLGSHSYTASKDAILGIMRTAACELGVHGIRVNCVSPHGVPSEMLVSAYRTILGKDTSPEDVSKNVSERGSLLLGRSATTEDVAYAAMFLAGDEAGFVTGHNLVVDGGYTAAVSGMAFVYKSTNTQVGNC